MWFVQDSAERNRFLGSAKPLFKIPSFAHSGAYPLVVPQHAGEPGAAHDLAPWIRRIRVDQRPIPQSLAGPFPVVVHQVLCHQMVQVLQANRDEVV